jgi:hypothetical protein
MSAEALWREVETRRICIVPVFRDKLWAASVEVIGKQAHNRNCAVQALSAIGSTCTGAVAALVERLDGEPGEPGRTQDTGEL